MKKMQLLIIFVAILGSNMIGATMASSEQKKVLALLWEDKDKNGRYSYLYWNCEQDYSSDCQNLVNAISSVIKHNQVRGEILSIQKTLNTTKDERAKEIMKEKLQKIQTNNPFINQNYLETLSEKEQEDLEKSIRNLLSTIAVKGIEQESKRIDEILSGQC